MREYEAYFFDLDGTLIHTIDLIIDCFHYSLDYAAGLRIPEEEIRKNIGLPLPEQLKRHLGDRVDIDYPDVIEKHMAYQLAHWRDRVYVYSGMNEVLDCLRSAGKKLAIVTSRRKKTAELYTAELGIRDYFQVLVTPEATTRHKPHPEPALTAMKATGARSSESIFIGDSLFDIRSGQGAGMDTAYARWSDPSREDPPEKPTYWLKHPSDLLV